MPFILTFDSTFLGNLALYGYRYVLERFAIASVTKHVTHCSFRFSVVNIFVLSGVLKVKDFSC